MQPCGSQRTVTKTTTNLGTMWTISEHAGGPTLWQMGHCDGGQHLVPVPAADKSAAAVRHRDVNISEEGFGQVVESIAG